MDCPQCGLVNPPSAERCDCGFDLAQPASSIAAARDKQIERERLLAWIGAGIALGAISISALSWWAAPWIGGRAWIFHGAAIAGGGLCARSFARWRSAVAARRAEAER